MKALNRKLFRDLLQMKGQALTISLVMACGIAVFTMSLSTLDSLESARSAYYDHYRFAHVFAHLKRAPNALQQRMSEIPGVSLVEARVVVDVVLDIPGLDEPAIGRLVSIPEDRPSRLNRLHIRSGRTIEPGRTGEILVSEPLAEAHGFKPGDEIRAVINGRLDTLRIVGIAISPEYIYQIRAGDIFPDNKRFGVFWMGYEELSTAYDLEGAFNDVALALMPGASEPDVLFRLDRLIEPYGGQGSFGREDQLSHRLISDEMTQLRGMSLIIPSIFLTIAAFIINIVLSRLINTQREQVASLKAFGYTRFEIGFHYLKFALAMTAAGSFLGIGAGMWLGAGITELYAQYFSFPSFSYTMDPLIAGSALLIGGTAAGFGVLSAVHRAVRLAPAEAMRPEPPANYRATVLERLGLQRVLSPPVRMIMRQVERRPWRAILSCLGIALSVAILVVSNFMEDTVRYVIDFQFYTVQRQDMTLTLIEPRSAGEALSAISNLPGVLRVEPFRSVPVRLRHEHRSRRTGVMGLSSRRELFRLMDLDERLVTLPEEGLVLSEKLAELLGVRPGDRVTVEVMEGQRPVLEAQVSALLSDFSGTSAYMDLDALNRMMREGRTLSGAFITVDANDLIPLYREIKNTPALAGASLKKAALQSFEEILTENLLTIKAFYLVFASIIALGVVYNSVHVTLSERSRELATLRVMGFTRGEVSLILLGEIAILTAVAIPLGLALGYGLANLTVYALETETQRFPLVIEFSTYVYAAVAVMVATVLSGLTARRKIDRLDLVSALKSQD